MNQQTTRQETRIPLLHGWLSSIALHGSVLLCFLSLFRQSLIPVSKEPFHWDVALVQSTQTADESVHNTNATESAISKPKGRTPIPARAVRTARHVTSSERIVPIDQTAEPVAPASQPSIASSAASPRESTTASISDKPMSNQPQASDHPLPQADRPVNSTTAEPTAQTAAATSSGENMKTADPAHPLLPPTTVLDTEAASTSRPDYGWLQQAISRRLEELKRSFRPSLDESRPLKVTVKAVVSREGILLDSAVVKSSGLDRIDQEAIALVQRAFPMQFDRTLDRQHIVMHIPIAYSRE